MSLYITFFQHNLIPKFSAAGLLMLLYDLELFNWNCLKASIASEFGSADPLLEIFPDLGVRFPGLAFLLPSVSPSISFMEHLLCSLGANDDFLLLTHADLGSFARVD